MRGELVGRAKEEMRQPNEPAVPDVGEIQTNCLQATETIRQARRRALYQFRIFEVFVGC